jgi:tetratricopeptide (TPR) repeat protein
MRVLLLLLSLFGFAAFSAWGEIAALAFSPDGRRLATLDAQGTLYVHETTTREEALRIEGPARGDVVAWRPGHPDQFAVALDQGEGWDIWLIDLSAGGGAIADGGAEGPATLPDESVPAPTPAAPALSGGESADESGSAPLGDRAGLRRLTHHPAKDHSPQWLDRGETLLFVSHRGDGEIALAGDGSAPATIAPAPPDLAQSPREVPKTQAPSPAQGDQRARAASPSGADLYTLNMTTLEVSPFIVRPYDQWCPRTQSDGEGVAYLTLEKGRLQVWLAARDRTPFRVARLDLADCFLGEDEIAWDRGGNQLLCTVRDREEMRLLAFDAPMQSVRVLAEERRIERPALDDASGYLFFESDKGLRLERQKGVFPLGLGRGRRVTAAGLSLGRTALGRREGKDLLAAAAEECGVAIGAAPGEDFQFLFLTAADHLLLAARLSSLGRWREAEDLYAELVSRVSDPDEAALVHLHRLARLLEHGRARPALAELDRLAGMEPPLLDPREILALRGEIHFFETGDLEAARWMLEAGAEGVFRTAVDPRLSLAILDSGSPDLIALYAKAHAALRRGEPRQCLRALRRMARLDPPSALVCEAALDLLDDPYDEESRPPWSSRFVEAGQEDEVADVLRLLEKRSEQEPEGGDLTGPGAALGAGTAEEASGAETAEGRSAARVRTDLLQALVTANRLDEARDVALRILDRDGAEPLGLHDLFTFYLTADRHDARTHVLVYDVLLDPAVAPRLGDSLSNDPPLRVLASLARAKAALLEGDTDDFPGLLSAARSAFQSVPSQEGVAPQGGLPAQDESAGETEPLQIYLYLFEAKHRERLEEWDRALEAYEAVQAMASRFCPERTGLALRLETALSEVAVGRSCGNALRELQLIERGLGDALLNPTNDPPQLRVGVRNLLHLHQTSSPSPLDPFILYHVGLSLGRCGQPDAAHYYLDRALESDPTPPLRLAILWEKAGLFGTTEDWWQQWRACAAMLSLAPGPAVEDGIRLEIASSLLHLGMERQAAVLLGNLVDTTPVPHFRDTAAQMLENLSGP